MSADHQDIRSFVASSEASDGLRGSSNRARDRGVANQSPLSGISNFQTAQRSKATHVVLVFRHTLRPETRGWLFCEVNTAESQISQNAVSLEEAYQVPEFICILPPVHAECAFARIALFGEKYLQRKVIKLPAHSLAHRSLLSSKLECD